MTKKIVLISLSVGLVIAGVAYAMDAYSNNFDISSYLLYTAVVSFFEVGILLVAGFIVLIAKIQGGRMRVDQEPEVLDAPLKRMEHKELARSFFLAAGLVLLIGTSLCFGGFFGSL